MCPRRTQFNPSPIRYTLTNSSPSSGEIQSPISLRLYSLRDRSGSELPLRSGEISQAEGIACRLIIASIIHS